MFALVPSGSATGNIRWRFGRIRAAVMLLMMLATSMAGCLPPVVAVVVAAIDGASGDKKPTNTAPGVVVGTIPRSENGTVQIPVTVFDAESNTVSLAVEIDRSDGDGFQPVTGTLTGATINATPGGAAATVEWDAAAELGDAYIDDLLVRVTPHDGSAKGQAATSTAFAFGNDSPTIIDVDIATNSQGVTSDITVVRLTVADSSSDRVAISAMEIALDGDFGNSPTTIPINLTHFPFGGTDNILSSDAGFTTLVAWDTFAIAPQDAIGAKIRVKVMDGSKESGFVESPAFAIDNAESAPVITLTGAPQSGQTVGGNITLDYTIADSDSDPAFIQVEVSTDGGNSFEPAIRAGGDATSGLATTPAGVAHSFVWYGLQVGQGPVTDVQLRITVGDTLLGNDVTTDLFTVDNTAQIISPPTATITGVSTSTGAPRMAGVSGDYIAIDFTLRDNNPSDTVDVVFEYTTDGGMNWFACTPHSTSAGTSALAAGSGTGTAHQFRWEPFVDAQAANGLFTYLADDDGDSVADREVIQFTPTVQLRLTPANSAPVNTPGSPVGTSLALGNTAPLVTADPIGNNQTKQVHVIFTLFDGEFDPLDITVEYERDDDPGNWHPATILLGAAETTDLASSPTGRVHLVAWNARNDLEGDAFRGQIRLRLVATDGDGGIVGTMKSVPAITNSFFIFQNTPPAVVFATNPLPPGPLPDATYNGTVALDITVSDAQDDLVAVTIEYSLNGGTTWKLGTLQGTTANLATNASGLNYTVTWAARRDLAWQINNTVRLRIYATDTERSAPDTLSADFGVDNRSAFNLSETAFAGVRLDGIDANEESGISISGVGDVDGDGADDFVIGARLGKGGNGAAYLIFGGAKLASAANDGVYNLTTELTPARGGIIVGIANGNETGFCVAAAGDINGDGTADLLVSAFRATANGNAAAGRTFLIFGGATLLAAMADGSFDLATDLVAGTGVRFDGIDDNDLSGRSVSGVGDINGDGTDDMLIGASESGTLLAAKAGESYLIYGGAPLASVTGDGVFNLSSELNATTGVIFPGSAGGDLSGFSVTGLGDVNGDGFADLGIGAYGSGLILLGANTGRVLVIYGGPTFVTAAGDGQFTLSEITAARGCRIEGAATGDKCGYTVRPAGDVNGDKYADILVTALDAGGTGRVYLIFGQPGTALGAGNNILDLASELTAARGVRIQGVSGGDLLGEYVTGIGDFNGDGFDDILVGSRTATANGVLRAGKAYLILGGPSFAGVTADGVFHIGSELDATTGTVFNGVALNDEAGRGVGCLGDINGDGFADFAIGAAAADPNLQLNAGSTYAIYGTDFVPPSTAQVSMWERPNDPLRRAFGVLGDQTNHASPTVRLWIDWADGHGPIGVNDTSATTVTLTRDTTGLSSVPGGDLSAVAKAYWQISTTRINFTTFAVTLKYTDAEVADINEAALKIYRAPATNGPWTQVAGAIFDTARNTVTFTTDQPGVFIIAE